MRVLGQLGLYETPTKELKKREGEWKKCEEEKEKKRRREGGNEEGREAGRNTGLCSMKYFMCLSL